MSKRTMEELMMLPYETLCNMALNGEITWSEWIETQGTDYAGYAQWLKDKGYSGPSDDAALEYIKQCKERMMDSEIPSGVQSVMDNVDEILSMKKNVNFMG